MKTFIISILFICTPVSAVIPNSAEVEVATAIPVKTNRKITLPHSENHFSNDISIMFCLLFKNIE
jgi:hypothetical protein